MYSIWLFLCALVVISNAQVIDYNEPAEPIRTIEVSDVPNLGSNFDRVHRFAKSELSQQSVGAKSQSDDIRSE